MCWCLYIIFIIYIIIYIIYYYYYYYLYIYNYIYYIYYIIMCPKSGLFVCKESKNWIFIFWLGFMFDIVYMDGGMWLVESTPGRVINWWLYCYLYNGCFKIYDFLVINVGFW